MPQPPWFPVSGVELREPQPDDSCTELLFPPRFPMSGAELREPQPDDSCTELLFPPWAPQPEFSVPRFEDCGGVNVRHPDRDGCSEGEPPPRFEIIPWDEE